MKILCISDQIDPLIYSNNAKERFKDIDLVLAAGDLPMEYIDYVVSTLNKITLFVFGNHNLKNFNRFHNSSNAKKKSSLEGSATHLAGAAYVGFKVLKEGNLLIAGASGSLRYNKGEAQYSDRQMHWKLIKLIPLLLYNKIRFGRYIDIFLTHAPPLGIHDKEDRCHRGFKSFLWFMRIFKPKYLVHGHIHLYDLQDVRESIYEHTKVVNAFSHHIIDF